MGQHCISGRRHFSFFLSRRGIHYLVWALIYAFKECCLCPPYGVMNVMIGHIFLIKGVLELKITLSKTTNIFCKMTFLFKKKDFYLKKKIFYLKKRFLFKKKDFEKNVTKFIFSRTVFYFYLIFCSLFIIISCLL